MIQVSADRGKARCRGVGEHNKPYAKEAEKLCEVFSPLL